jgi:hypothetical protein
VDDGGMMDKLYRVCSTLEGHKSTESSDLIVCQYLKPVLGDVGGEQDFTMTDEIYDSYTADQLTSVLPGHFKVTKGKVTNKATLCLKLDIAAYLKWYENALKNDEEDEVMEEGGAGQDAAADDLTATQVFNTGTLSMEEVLEACSDFRDVKSMLEEKIEGRGHLLNMSPKYHCELAGQGVEYCFGRDKMWFKRVNPRTGMASLRKFSLDSFKDADGRVTLHHARKFARKCRDYMRVYRSGIKEALVDMKVKH